MLLFAVLLIAGCRNAGKQDGSFHLPFQTATVDTAQFYATYSGYGQIKSLRSTDLAAKYDGYFYLPEAVKKSYRKGEVIYRLTGPEIDLQREILTSQRDEARADYTFYKELWQRKKDLRKKQFIAVDEWKKLQRDYRVAVRRFAKADSAYQYFLSVTRFRAPFDGYLTDLSIEQNGFIKKEQKIGRFVAMTGLKLVGEIFANPPLPQPDSTLLVILNDSIRVYGRLLFLENALNPATGGREFWLSLHSGNYEVHSGDFVHFSIKFNRKQMPAIPESALVFEKKKWYVVTVQHNKFRNEPVKIGRRTMNFMELLAGPPVGTKIVTTGSFELFHSNLKNVMKIED